MSKYLELWLLKCMVRLYLLFSETAKLSSKAAIYFILTLIMKESCSCTTLLSVIGVTVSWILIAEMGFPHGSASKEPACNAGDLGSIPGLGRSPGERKGYPLQYSGLENSTECIVHEVAKSWRQPRDFHFNHWNRYTVILIGNYYKWYHTFFINIFAIYVSSLVRYLLDHLLILKILSSCCVLRVLYIICIHSFMKCIFKIFAHSLLLYFVFLNGHLLKRSF